MSNPLIQIGDEIREMTSEEYAHYLSVLETMPQYPDPISIMDRADETPTAD